MESFAPWYVVLVSAVIFPALTGLLKKWGPAEDVKRLVALAVSIIVAAAGLLIGGSLTWDTLLPSWGLVYASGTVVYQVWSRGGEAVTKMIAPLVVLALVLTAGCAGVPTVPIPASGGAAAKGGDSDAAKMDVETPFAPAVAQPGGTANARAVVAKVERANTNSAAGESLIGVSFSGGDSFAEQMKTDPVIVSLSQRIVAATKAKEPDKALLADLYAAYREQAERIGENVKKTSPDFASLKVINVMVLVCKDNGAAEGETGDEQSRVVAEAMAQVVAATMGAVDEPAPKDVPAKVDAKIEEDG